MKVLDRMSVKQLLFDDLEDVSLPASILVDPKNDEWEAPQHPRFQINAKMETLIARSADVSSTRKSTAFDTNSTRLSSMFFGRFA